MATIEESIIIKEKIFLKAKELGFIDMKIAKYQTLSEEIQYYKKWISEGKNATMGWMERNFEKREDVREILPNTNSILCFSFNYFTGNIHKKESNTDIGKISRYAWGSDYHDILSEKLKEIENYIKELIPQAETKYYADTGPTLDKQWAVKSGLSWQGKNSLTISPEYGSYFFIGIIFTSAKLPNDTPIKDYCGTCTKCIQACPTNAIVDNKIVDANKCIAYWTIEAKHDIDIPEYITNNAKNWIFGCDICQEVCPWNQNKPKITEEILLKSRFENGMLEKKFIESLEQEDFSKIFKNSPIKRLKIAGLKRNSLQILK